MHCHVLLYLTCRMLKVFNMLLCHDIPMEKECYSAFKRLDGKTALLGDAFGLLKFRIQTVKLTLRSQGNTDFDY